MGVLPVDLYGCFGFINTRSVLFEMASDGDYADESVSRCIRIATPGTRPVVRLSLSILFVFLYRITELSGYYQFSNSCKSKNNTRHEIGTYFYAAHSILMSCLVIPSVISIALRYDIDTVRLREADKACRAQCADDLLVSEDTLEHHS